MKTAFLAVIALAFTAVTGAAANPASLPMGIDISERDGVLEVREVMKEFVPDITEREWTETKLCWDSNTLDNDFLITHAPTHKNLSLAIGGSGHGFKFLPTIGKYIVDMLQGALTDDAIT
ncbi:hypothetical protein FDECE_1893 [Fusarium decemcellulare]|nr:hypothetical protein FDECE_1893 [Fusarium decemcellulare]